MISIIFILVLGLIGFYLPSKLKKNKVILYIIFTVLGVLSILFHDVNITTPINQGYLGFAFFYVVMVTGLFNKDSKMFKNLNSVRSIYSIIGFIILTPHAIFYILDKFTRNGLFDVVGLLAYLIMIPLFITSFQNIDKPQVKFRWKKIQRFAYIVYILIFVHLIIVSSVPNSIMYFVLFIPYLLYKPYHFFKHEKPYYQKLKNKIMKITPKENE
jgi:DMSO/TMAO reductase YedYZ heme-binding membrane subunit